MLHKGLLFQESFREAPPGSSHQQSQHKISRAQLSQVMFLTKTRKHNWLHQHFCLTTPRMCLSPSATPHQLSGLNIQTLKRGGNDWEECSDRVGPICLEVLWAGWSLSSDSFPKKGGEWPWGTTRADREPLWKELASALLLWLGPRRLGAAHCLFLVLSGPWKRRPSWEPPALHPLQLAAHPLRPGPWRNSTCSSSTSGPAQSQ